MTNSVAPKALAALTLRERLHLFVGIVVHDVEPRIGQVRQSLRSPLSSMVVRTGQGADQARRNRVVDMLEVRPDEFTRYLAGCRRERLVVAEANAAPFRGRLFDFCAARSFGLGQRESTFELGAEVLHTVVVRRRRRWQRELHGGLVVREGLHRFGQPRLVAALLAAAREDAATLVEVRLARVMVAMFTKGT